MYNQTEAILSQYELEIRQITKGRGTYICDTDKGMKLLSPFKGSKEKGECLKQYLAILAENGYMTEQIYSNRNGEAVTEDEITGERFLVKDYVKGTELSTAHFGEMIEVAGVLAKYHLAAERAYEQMRNANICQSENGKFGSVDVVDVRVRHCRELVKVRNYIRSRKKKQEFERLYMVHFQEMFTTAEYSCDILKEEAARPPQSLMCHGDCNHHNVVWSDGQWRMIHFENAVYSWAVWDLANYVRKMMEKNGWDEELGMEIVRGYDTVRPLEREGYLQLYGLLLFPEKFWKLTNHYMNSNKVWIPGRDIEKLEKVIAQEAKRLKFMENLFSIGQK